MRASMTLRVTSHACLWSPLVLLDAGMQARRVRRTVVGTYAQRNPSQILLWDGLISNPRYHPYSEDRMSMSSALEPPVCRRMHPLILHAQHLYMSYDLMLPAVFAEDSDAEIHSAGQHRPLSKQAALFGWSCTATYTPSQSC